MQSFPARELLIIHRQLERFSLRSAFRSTPFLLGRVYRLCWKTLAINDVSIDGLVQVRIDHASCRSIHRVLAAGWLIVRFRSELFRQLGQELLLVLIKLSSASQNGLQGFELLLVFFLCVDWMISTSLLILSVSSQEIPYMLIVAKNSLFAISRFIPIINYIIDISIY